MGGSLAVMAHTPEITDNVKPLVSVVEPSVVRLHREYEEYQFLGKENLYIIEIKIQEMIIGMFLCTNSFVL